MEPEKDDVESEFFAIADNMVSEQANDYLDQRLVIVDEWVADRVANGQPADLHSLIMQLMHEPNRRGPVIVTLAAALWRLRKLRDQ